MLGSKIAVRQAGVLGAVLEVSVFEALFFLSAWFFEAVLYGRASVILGLKQSRGVLRVSLERHPNIKPFSVEISGNDVCLTDFMEVKIGGENCSIL